MLVVFLAAPDLVLAPKGPRSAVTLRVGDRLRVELPVDPELPWELFLQNRSGLRLLGESERRGVATYRFVAQSSGDWRAGFLLRAAAEAPSDPRMGRRRRLKRQVVIDAAIYARDTGASPAADLRLGLYDAGRGLSLAIGRTFAIELEGSWRVDPLPPDLVQAVGPVRKIAGATGVRTRVVLRTVGPGSGEIELFRTERGAPRERWPLFLGVRQR